MSFPFEILKVITLLYLASREECLQNPTQIFTFFLFSLLPFYWMPIRQLGKKYDRVKGGKNNCSNFTNWRVSWLLDVCW